MKKIAKASQFILIMAIVLSFNLTPAFADSAQGKIDYVAFGDSVAAGVRGGVGDPGSELESDYGYTDNIANMLKAAGILGSFNESFCTSGMTAKGLAESTAVLNDTECAEYLLVKEAELATLDIGANDVMGPLYEYVSTLDNIMQADIAKIKGILDEMVASLSEGTVSMDIQANIEMILQSILYANPNIKIYVMGYYNPLPAAASLAKLDLETPIESLNTNIKKAISNILEKNKDASITYVATMAAMAQNSDKNLVATDIHPTQAGYEVISDEFWNYIEPNVNAAAPETSPETATASPTKASVLINGKTVAFEAYSIDGNNYFKLRDLAMALNGSAVQFEVIYDNESKEIQITSTKAYTVVGGEMAAATNTEKIDASKTKSNVLLDGVKIDLTAYLIGGNNYIKLRDLAAEIDFGVDWDDTSNTIKIDTSKGYIT